MSVPDAKAYRDAAAAMAKWRRPLLISHAKPDGDALGSLVAMQSLLRSGGAAPVALLFDAIPDRYALFQQYPAMPIWESDVHASDLAACDGVIALDTCTYSQLDPIAEWLRATDLPKFAIDHHITRDDLADHYLIDETAAATCLILHDWARVMGWPIDGDAAAAMFIGIAMDTGWFVHSNTDQRVLSASADLIDRGALPHELHQQLYQRETPARVRLLGAALQAMELLADHRLAVMVLSLDAITQAGATPADTEDIVNEPLRIGSVVASVLLVESERGLIRASFRSKPPTTGDGDGADLDVAEVARAFGGGGHKRAAGARIAGTLDEVRASVVETLVNVLSV